MKNVFYLLKSLYLKPRLTEIGRHVGLLLLLSFGLSMSKTNAQDVLWGTAFPGPQGAGAVFSINSDDTNFQVRKTFTLPPNFPPGNLLEVGDGYLYGLTNEGGHYDLGTIFKVSIDGSSTEVLRSFSGPDGARPTGNLIIGPTGDWLFGMASAGGSDYNNGTIFKINTDGSGFEVLRQLSTEDGISPRGSLLPPS